MGLSRRGFIALSGTAAVAAARPALAQGAAALDGEAFWAGIRGRFALSSDVIHMSALLIASHPDTVRAAIARHRDGLDADPVRYLEDNVGPLGRAALAAAARYLGTGPNAIALTDSTTMGVGLVYNGLRLLPGEEILTTVQDYYVTQESLRLAVTRTGASLHKIELYELGEPVSADELADRVANAVGPLTRVVALTWVHSSTGVKLPIRAIADRLAVLNETREEGREILLCVDGVHGFGNQDVTIADLGCDVLMAGCHKWLFGPRGTGLIAVGARGWLNLLPTIPSFDDNRAWNAWQIGSEPPSGATAGVAMTSGGFKAFEHRWALAEAFAFHDEIGKARIAARTAELAGHLKEGLAAMENVRLYTPMDPALSAGIVSFDVAGWSAQNTVAALRERGLIASVAPYSPPHARLTPSIHNSHEEIDRALAAIAEL